MQPVLGLTNLVQTSSVNGSAADYRRGEYFQEAVTASNASAADWKNVSVTTSGGGSASGNVFVPKTPEPYTYDLDGNTLTDGRWTYTWNAENHLITLVGHTGLSTVLRLELEYDHQGRRIRKRVWNNPAGTGAPTLERKYLYDSWNLLAELDGGNVAQRSYIWGLDLSGALPGQGIGAGGVGGLILARNHVTPAGYHFTCFDGNGNVTALVDASTGNYSAHYEYDSFGQPLRATGAMAKLNPFRFSTKYTDDETDLLYYGYRYYNPSIGRWLSRDPIAEYGGISLYTSVGNNLIAFWDYLGLLKEGDQLDVIYKCSKIGHVLINEYVPIPLSGKKEHRVNTVVGANLTAVADISCECRGNYKWRQYINEKRGDEETKRDELDIGNRNPKRDGEWYSDFNADPLSSICAYTFLDHPRQSADIRLEFPPDNPRKIDKVIVSFTLQLVRVEHPSQKSGGEVVLTINWGFWYTRNQNGILGDD